MKTWSFCLVLCAMFIINGSEYVSVHKTVATISEGSQVRIDSVWLKQQDLFAHKSVNAIYRANSYALIWHHGRITLPRATALLEMLTNADQYGLIGAEYNLDKADSLANVAPSDAVTAQRDVIITDAYFKFASHLRSGRLKQDGTLRSIETDVDTTLISSALEPVSNEAFRSVLENSQPGDIHFKSLSKAYRTTLVEYKRYLITEDTISALGTQLLKMAINLERLRWDYGNFDAQHILVNIPAYEVAVYEDDSLVLSSKVIVGTNVTRTPELSSYISCFRIYPYWHVPRSIATKEILPTLKRDPGYLERMRFDVLNTKGQRVDHSNIDWKKYSASNFPFILRQREGTDNSLGIVKFEFENRYGVYLHDTNAKGLFNQTVRAFSHGCVRVEKATELARYLNRTNGGGASDEDLTAYFQEKKRRDVNLSRQAQILIRYWTADEKGVYDDVYGRDEKLLEMFSELLPEERELVSMEAP